MSYLSTCLALLVILKQCWLHFVDFWMLRGVLKTRSRKRRPEIAPTFPVSIVEALTLPRGYHLPATYSHVWLPFFHLVISLLSGSPSPTSSGRKILPTVSVIPLCRRRKKPRIRHANVPGPSSAPPAGHTKKCKYIKRSHRYFKGLIPHTGPVYTSSGQGHPGPAGGAGRLQAGH